MKNNENKEVFVQAVIIKNEGYCPFCAKKTRRVSYGKHQKIEGFDDYCSCDRALKNDRLQDEVDKLERKLRKLKHRQAKIPTSIDKLMPLAEDSQESTSQPE